MTAQNTFSVQVFGLGFFQDRMDQLKKRAYEAWLEETRKMAINTVQESKRIVAVKTGFLKNSIFVREHDFNKFEIVASAPYAGYVEYGTSKMRAQPYLRPALMKYADSYEKDIARNWENKIKS